MKNLFIVRHGHRNFGEDQLSETGKGQITVLAKKIGSACEGQIRVFVSPTNRTRESARIIRDLLPARVEGFEGEPLLFSSHTKAPETKKILEWIGAISWDNLVVIGHVELTEKFPATFGQTVLQVDTSEWSTVGLPPGDAWHIPCEEKTIKRLRGS